jgi:thiol-disulfide isomerase/thioredoxin
MTKRLVQISRWVLAITFVSASLAFAADETNPEADKIWKDVESVLKPDMPKEWQTKPPGEEERNAFFKPLVIKGLDKSREFYTKFPKDKRAEKAEQLEAQLLGIADQFGVSDVTERMKQFTNEASSTKLKAMIAANLERADMVGKPVNIKFKAVDGRDVDLTNMKGKVVLVDFWATWCGPCVGEIPHVKEAYSELHPKGFEIVGISLDSDKSKLTKFVADKGMDWPQYFDGKQWQNEIATKYGIESIPAMWLIDKKGNLRDTNARADLKGKVEKLLAE